MDVILPNEIIDYIIRLLPVDDLKSITLLSKYYRNTYLPKYLNFVYIELHIDGIISEIIKYFTQNSEGLESIDKYNTFVKNVKITNNRHIQLLQKYPNIENLEIVGNMMKLNYVDFEKYFRKDRNLQLESLKMSGTFTEVFEDYDDRCGYYNIYSIYNSRFSNIYPKQLFNIVILDLSEMVSYNLIDSCKSYLDENIIPKILSNHHIFNNFVFYRLEELYLPLITNNMGGFLPTICNYNFPKIKKLRIFVSTSYINISSDSNLKIVEVVNNDNKYNYISMNFYGPFRRTYDISFELYTKELFRKSELYILKLPFDISNYEHVKIKGLPAVRFYLEPFK